MLNKFSLLMATLALGVGVSFSPVALAEVPLGGDDNAYHAYNELGVKVLTRGNAYNVADVLADPTVRIFILQVPFEVFDLSCCESIMEWVRQGHTLWFYDSRYAPYFGMKSYYLAAEQFRGRPEEGPIGDVKYKGMAAVVLSFENHVSMTGVGQCTIFIPEVAPGVYSAVAVEGDTVPLLRFASDSPALAALRRDGRGAVIFKPLLWPESLSGKRFQNNLLEYSGGFGVPGIGAQGRFGEEIGASAPYVETQFAAKSQIDKEPVRVPEKRENVISQDKYVYAKSLDDQSSNVDVKKSENVPPANHKDANHLVDIVTLRNGSTLIGRCSNGEFHFETTSDSLKIKTDEIKVLNVSKNSWSLDKVEQKDGSVASGYLMTEKIHFSVNGEERVFKKDDIKEIQFNVPMSQVRNL